MNENKLTPKTLSCLALFIGILVFILFLIRFCDIDSCLDRGGSWDEAVMRCDFGTPESCREEGGIWDTARGRCANSPYAKEQLLKSQQFFMRGPEKN